MTVRGIWGPLGYTLLGVLLLLTPLAVPNAYYVHVAIIIAVNIILAMSFRLVMTTGQVNFAQAGFMLVGAYTSTLLVMKLGISTWLALPVSALMATVIAVLIGYPTLKIKGVYFFIITFAFSQLLDRTVRAWPGLFGGTPGISGIPGPDPLSLPVLGTIDFASKTQFYYFAVVLLAMTFLVMLRFERSRLGKTFAAIGTDDFLAQSLGVNLMGYKILAFAASCLFAGLAGSFYAHYVRVISPDSFSVNVMIFVLTYVVVGGQGSIWGPVIGATIMSILVEMFRVAGAYQVMLFAVLLILVVIFLRGGLIKLPETVVRVMKRLIGKGADANEAA